PFVPRIGCGTFIPKLSRHSLRKTEVAQHSCHGEKRPQNKMVRPQRRRSNSASGSVAPSHKRRRRFYLTIRFKGASAAPIPTRSGSMFLVGVTQGNGKTDKALAARL